MNKKLLLIAMLGGLFVTAGTFAKDKKMCLNACKSAFENAKKECGKADKMLKASCNTTATKANKDCVKACNK